MFLSALMPADQSHVHSVLHCSKYLSRLVTKPTKRHMHPAKTQISLSIRAVWSESSLSAWRKRGSLATQWAHSEDSDQTGRMPRLIWVFTGRTVILLVLSWGGSYPDHVHGSNFIIFDLQETKAFFLRLQTLQPVFQWPQPCLCTVSDPFLCKNFKMQYIWDLALSIFWYCFTWI